jgi:NAD(P)-dependent dehydrogenase (short-subunit alcohol dehydrogenase family)
LARRPFDAEEARMDLGLAGRVALVTAGSRRLGFAAAKALAAEGASLLVCAREPLRLEDAAAQLREVAGTNGERRGWRRRRWTRRRG